MHITVKVIGGLALRLGFTQQEREVPSGATAGSLLEALGIADPLPTRETLERLGLAGEAAAAEQFAVLS